ncbi:MAG: LuxR C-terminal-related transcriptional regulator [Anaerolineae bacterium]
MEERRSFSPAERERLALVMDDLTAKQREVASLVLSGCSLTAIADRLDLGDSTVRGFVRRIKRRLQKT